MRRSRIRQIFQKQLAIVMSVVVLAGTVNVSRNYNIHADSSTVTLGKGSYSTVTKGKQVYSQDAGLVDRATEQTWWPKPSVKGNVYVTDNLKGAIPTSDWATSFLWGTMYGGVTNPFSQPAYAFPLAYEASAEGMYLTKPPVHMVSQSGGALDYCMPLQPGYIDLAVKPTGFTPTDCKVDKVTDWTYDVVMENGSQQMKTTMSQGSPYAYFEFANTDMEINFKRGTQMLLVSGSENDNVLVIKILDNKENDWNYYAIFGPEGVKWSFIGDSVFLTKITADFPEDKSYCSIAALPEESTDVLDLYKKYAYNFISDTKAEWSYDEKSSMLLTTYSIETENKAESTAEGTIIGVLPHQYKNMDRNTTYLNETYSTIRGTMKLLTGSGFQTKMAYTGVLPYMPDIADEDEGQLRTYVNDYMEETKNNATPYLYIGEGNGDTYWTGKGLNKLVNVMAAAEELGETAKAKTLLNTLKSILEDWFSTTDSEQDNYFYYNKEVGTLVGYPSSYGSDTQLNDHHFHYGYWINAAAQVALRDPQWAKDSGWGAMVKELIGDIASTDRTNSRYPYLRNFAPYEGHSWASGHELFGDGNNQESSSEAVNAWAGIILFGEATGDTSLRDLGIYLYTTEISAVDNYWFDLDKDVLSPQYRYRDQSATAYDPSREEKQIQASMIWGGKYVYGTWWTDEPLQIQGINLLPVTASSFYLAKDKDYVEQNYTSARKREDSYTGNDKLSNPYDRWNDVWHEYLAMADPDKALANWSSTADEENGESRAHTWHFIKSLQKYGTPDLTITSDDALSAVFEKNGVKYYCAFNPTEEPLKVTFSNGASITVKAHSMHTGLNETNNLNGTDILVTDEPETTTAPTVTASAVVSAAPSVVPSSNVSSSPEVTDFTSASPEATKTPAVSGTKSQIGDYGYLEMMGESTAKIVFTKTTNWVDVHYRVNGGIQMNYRMPSDGENWCQSVTGLKDGDELTMFFTYYDTTIGGAKDTAEYTVAVAAAGETAKPDATEEVSETMVPSQAVTTVPVTVSPETSIGISLVKPVITAATQNSGSTICQNLIVSNGSSESIELDKLTVRFYYTKDGNKEQVLTCDSAGLTLNESPYYVSLTSAVSGAFDENYVDITFASDVSLTDGCLTVQNRIYQSDWSGYTGFEDGGYEVFYDGVKVK